LDSSFKFSFLLEHNIFSDQILKFITSAYYSLSFKGIINTQLIKDIWKIQKSVQNESLSSFLFDLYFSSNDENCFESFFSYCLEANLDLNSIQLLKKTCQVIREWKTHPLISISLLFEDKSSKESPFLFNFPKRVSTKSLYLYVSKHLKNNLSIDSFSLFADGQKLENLNLIDLNNSKSIQFHLINDSFTEQTQYNFSFVPELLSKYVKFLDKEEIFTPLLFDIFSCFPVFPNEKETLLNEEFHFSSYFERKPFSFFYHLRSFSFFIDEIPKHIANTCFNEISFDQFFSFLLTYQEIFFSDIQRFIDFILILENIFKSESFKAFSAQSVFPSSKSFNNFLSTFLIENESEDIIFHVLSLLHSFSFEFFIQQTQIPDLYNYFQKFILSSNSSIS
jgi:hypothetical protein